MQPTKIVWADMVWNPIRGCTKISDGCLHCYGESMAKRFNGGDFYVTLHPERLDEPMRRRKPAKIFVCSMSDLFHKDVPNEFLYRIFQIIKACPQHTFLILTKRIERAKDYLPRAINGWPFENCWLGVTAENQARADERIPLLLQTPAAKRFVSYEPALGPVGISPWIPSADGFVSSDKGPIHVDDGAAQINWVIAGGESGPGARPCKEEWIQSVYEQCQAAGVPFFFKSGGDNWMRRLRLDGGLVQLWDWEKRRKFPK
jgi:protein gp37